MSRTRTDGYTRPTVQCVRSNYAAAGVCGDSQKVTFSGYTYSTYVPEEYTRVMIDTVTPNWNLRRNCGEIINNPYDKSEVLIQRDPISWTEARRTYAWNTCSGISTPLVNTGGRWIGVVAPDVYMTGNYLAPPALNKDTYHGLAITAAHAKVSEADAQMLVVLAEGEKTIQSVTSIIRRLIKILYALKRCKWWKLRRELTAKQLADRWMEGRYAIRPLVYDAIGIVKALTRDRNKNPERQTYRSGQSASDQTSQSGVVTYGNGTYWEIRCGKLSTVTLTVRSGVLCALDKISEATIWGLTQPIEAVWELVPFSFVVDWFFNVGKTIASWTPKYGIRSLASWVTGKEVTEQSIYTEGGYLRSWNPSNVFENVFAVSGGRIKKTTTHSYRLVDLQRPLVPQFELKLNAAKLLDLAIMGRRFFS